MENNYDPMGLTPGHHTFFGRRISYEEFVGIISKYPASQWLDLFAKIESFLFFKRMGVSDIQTYITEKILPPSTLSRIERHSKKYTLQFFTLGQLNILRKAAITYGIQDTETEAQIQLVDISKVLLAAQDFHGDYDDFTNQEKTIEGFWKFVIRSWYLNNHSDITNLLMRTHQMYVARTKNIPFLNEYTFTDFFEKNVGISIEDAMSLCFALATPLLQNKEDVVWKTTIIDLKTFFASLSIDKEKIESIIKTLTVDLVYAKEVFSSQLTNIDTSKKPIGYDMDLFRKNPIIRLSSGKIVCVSLISLFEKITQNIIWMPLSQIANLEKRERDILVNTLTDYRGKLFEEYIRYLCKEMEQKNESIKYFYIPPENTTDHEEVGDAILIQGKNIAIIEAKSAELREGFKSTGDWDKDPKLIEEVVKKAAEQIDKAAKKIMTGQVANFPLKAEEIEKIYPVLITYEEIPTHAKILRLLRGKIKEDSFLEGQIFNPIEIMHPDNLETFMSITSPKTLIDLLQEKHATDPHAMETSFNNFLSYLIKKDEVVSNGWEMDQWERFYKKAIEGNLKFK